MPNFEKVRNELMSDSRFMAWSQTATPKEHELLSRVYDLGERFFVICFLRREVQLITIRNVRRKKLMVSGEIPRYTFRQHSTILVIPISHTTLQT